MALLLLALVMLLSLTACGGSDDEQTPAEEGGESTGEEIVINYPTFQVGTNTAAPVVAELVKPLQRGVRRPVPH